MRPGLEIKLQDDKDWRRTEGEKKELEEICFVS